MPMRRVTLIAGDGIGRDVGGLYGGLGSDGLVGAAREGGGDESGQQQR